MSRVYLITTGRYPTGERVLCTSSRIRVARRRLRVFGGLRILRLDPSSDWVRLHDYNRGTFGVRAREVS